MKKNLEISINPEESVIPAVCKAISTIAGQYFDEKRDLFQIENAVEEALDNIIIYSKSKTLQTIRILVETGNGEFTVSIFDTGIPGDYNETLKGEDRLGLNIMRGLMDRVSVINNGKDGRCQQFVKYYNRKKDPSAIEKNDEEQIISDAQITVRKSEKGDVLGICRKLYGEYGLTYAHAEIYYPEKFYAAIKKNDIFSVVAVDEKGNIVGHQAAWEWKNIPGVWESGMAVVDSRYRGQGVFDKMMKVIRNYVINESKAHLYISEATTKHIFSQKIRHKYGDDPCGFIFNSLDANALRGSFSEFNERTTDALAYSAFDKSEKNVYVPEEIRKTVEWIYAPQKLPRNIVTEYMNEEYAADTDITFSYNTEDACGDIYVKSAGSDFRNKLHEAYINIKNQEAKTIILYINIEDSGAIPLYEYAKNWGFFFTGLFPCTDFGDMMIMQKIVTGTIHYDHIHTTGPFTEMLNMIHTLDPDNKI